MGARVTLSQIAEETSHRRMLSNNEPVYFGECLLFGATSAIIEASFANEDKMLARGTTSFNMTQILQLLVFGFFRRMEQSSTLIHLFTIDIYHLCRILMNTQLTRMSQLYCSKSE